MLLCGGDGIEQLAKYVELANKQSKVTFVGRLGTYRYLDMDVTIREALDLAEQSLDLLKQQETIPAFFSKIV